MPDKNGVSLSNVGTTDMENLKVYVANTTPIAIKSKEISDSLNTHEGLLKELNSIIGSAFIAPSASSANESVEISSTPAVKDLVAAKGNLNATVPMGFIMLHNDLMDLFTTNMVNKPKKDSRLEGSDSIASEGLSILDSIKGILKVGGGTSLGGASLGASASFAPAIANLGKLAGFLTNPAVLGTAAAVGGIALLVNFIKNSEQREAENHMKHLMNELTLDMTLEDVKSNPQAIQARNESFAEYVKSYYKQQILQMKLESFSNTMASLIVGQVGRTFRALVESFKTDKKNSLQLIIEQLDANTDIDALARNPMIQVAQSQSIAEYVRNYYEAQTTQLKLESAINTFLPTNLLITGISSVFGNLVDTFTGREEPLKELIELMDESLVPNDLADNDIIRNARDEGIAEYVRVYYESQASELKAEGFGASVAGIFTGYVSKVFESLASFLTGKTDDTSVSSKLSTIIENLDANLNVADYDGTDEIIGAQKEGVLGFVRKYYEMQAEEVLKADKKSLGEKALGWLWDNSVGILTGLFEDRTASDNFKRAVTEIVSKPIDVSTIPADEINAIASKGVLDGAKAVLKANQEALESAYESSITARSLRSSPIAKVSEAYASAVAKTLNNAMGSVADSVNMSTEIDNSQTIEGVKYDDSSVVESLHAILQALVAMTDMLGAAMENSGTNIIYNDMSSDSDDMLLEG